MRAAVTYAVLVGAAWFGLGWAVDARAQELPTFHIVAREGRLIPNRIEVPAGTRIKLTLKNEGRGPVEFENLDLRVEKVLAPGASSFVVIHPLKPGSYRFIDEFHADTAEVLIVAR
ncbi:MAG: cupredoxin domain-containing protein [Rhodocyclaceae bacterium]|nr:cupredoxin domain-containing protein [Rhodocyclaceae bacterium]